MKGTRTDWAQFPGAGPGASEVAQAVRDGDAWRFDHGLWPWWHPGSALTVNLGSSLQAIMGQPVEGMTFWMGRWWLVSGTTFWTLDGNDGGLGLEDAITVLRSDLTARAPDDPPPAFLPWGRRMFVAAGGEVFLVDPDGQWRSAFAQTPGAPRPVDLWLEWFVDGSVRGTSFPKFEADDAWGLGIATSRNHYVYRIAEIVDGVEGPLSAPTSIYWKPDAAAKQWRFGVHLELPKPSNWRIYRSRNLRDSDTTSYEDAVLYHVADVQGDRWCDTIPDGLLVTEADNRAVPPPQGIRFLAAWDGRLWAATPTRVVWSQQSFPEDLRLGAWFDFSDPEGGEVTGLAPAGDRLLVFRRHAVEAVVFDRTMGSYRNFRLAAWGTRAGHAARLVPGQGLIVPREGGFMSWDGSVWTRIGPDDPREWERLDVSPRTIVAVGQDEAWWHFPADGSLYAQRGFALHLADGSWSHRHAANWRPYSTPLDHSAMAPYHGFIATTLVPGWSTGPDTVGDKGNLSIPHVWVPSNEWGKQLTVQVVGQDGVTYSTAGNVHPGRSYETGFIPLPEKTTALRVEAEVKAHGHVELHLSYATNGRYVWTTAPDQWQEDPDRANTAQADPTMGAGGNTFAPNEDTVDEERVVRLRWDISPRQASSIALRWSTDAAEPMTLVRYRIEAIGRGDRPRRQQ